MLGKQPSRLSLWALVLTWSGPEEESWTNTCHSAANQQGALGVKRVMWHSSTEENWSMTDIISHSHTQTYIHTHAHAHTHTVSCLRISDMFVCVDIPHSLNTANTQRLCLTGISSATSLSSSSSWPPRPSSQSPVCCSTCPTIRRNLIIVIIYYWWIVLISNKDLMFTTKIGIRVLIYWQIMWHHELWPLTDKYN